MAETIGTLSRVGAAPPVQSPPSPPSFGVGQQHVGAVLRVLPQGGVLAELNGQPLILEPGLSLLPGDTFIATVTEVRPALVLQLSRSTTVSSLTPSTLATAPHLPVALAHTETGNLLTPAQLKAYLLASQPLGQTFIALEQLLSQHPFLQELDAPLLQALRDTLQVLHPQGDRPLEATQLQEQVARSGLNYEKTVEHAIQGDPDAAAALTKDLKGQLLALSQRLEQAVQVANLPHAQQAAEVLTQVTRALDNIEFQQVLNQLAPSEHQPVVLPLLLPFAAPAQALSLAVQRDAHSGAGTPEQPERYTLVLQLDLSGLGPLHLATTVQGSQLSSTFQVPTADIASLVQEAAPTLVASLRELGFQAQVACEVQPHLGAEPALHVPRALSRALHAVDVTI